MKLAGPAYDWTLSVRTSRQSHPLHQAERSCGSTAGDRPAAFYRSSLQTFELAEQAAGGSVDCFYTIGGYTIRLRFAGPALVPFLTPALQHLATTATSEPALTVCLWDSVSTGVTMPPPPWSEDDYLPRGEVRGFSDQQIQTVFNLGSGILNVLHCGQNVALWWINDASQTPFYVSACPLRAILHAWMRQHGRQIVHGAAVGMPEGGALVVGKGGSGKSTLALACLTSQLLYLGDDNVLLAEGPTPFAHSVYNSAKLAHDHLHRLPHLWSAVRVSGRVYEQKALMFLHEHCPGKMAAGFPVRAILVPQITGVAETTFSPVSAAMALKAIAPSTIFQLSGAGATEFQTIVRIIRQVPCYRVGLGTDLGQVPALIVGLLSAG